MSHINPQKGISLLFTVLITTLETPDDCPLGPDYIGLDCNALNYCLKSAGSYQKVKRAIEIKY